MMFLCPQGPQNVRLTSDARPEAKAEGWREACWLSDSLSFLVFLSLFSVNSPFWTLKDCRHRDKAQVWFKRLLCSLFKNNL
jgi:hypothetical protein